MGKQIHDVIMMDFTSLVPGKKGRVSVVCESSDDGEKWEMHCAHEAPAVDTLLVAGSEQRMFQWKLHLSSQFSGEPLPDARLAMLERMKKLEQLIVLAQQAKEVIDDDLEERPARHSLGKLHAQLAMVLSELKGPPAGDLPVKS